MEQSYLKSNKHISGGATTAAIAMAVAVTLTQQATAAVVVNLGSASNFSVLAGSAITIAGPINSTTVTGDIGSFPTASITGLENLVLIGMNRGGDPVTEQAKIDLGIAYVDAAGRTADTAYGPIHELVGSLGAGVYRGSSSFSIMTTLTLDGGGDPNAVWIFQSESTLITASNSNILLINGAQASNVFWQVGSSATLGTYSNFVGTILASDSITLNTGADITGRALAHSAAVTLDNNIVTIPEPGSALLMGAGLLTLTLVTRRRRLQG